MRNIICAALCYAFALSGIEFTPAAETHASSARPSATAPREAPINLRAAPAEGHTLADPPKS